MGKVKRFLGDKVELIMELLGVEGEAMENQIWEACLALPLNASWLDVAAYLNINELGE